MPVSARYWRFRAGDVSWNTQWGYYHINLTEIALYESSDCSGSAIAASSATGSSQYSTTYTPGKAIDGNLSTFWSTAWHRSDGWISIDCGSAVSVDSFKFTRSIFNRLGIYWKNWIVEYSSDNLEFTELTNVDTENAAINNSWQEFHNLQPVLLENLFLTNFQKDIPWLYGHWDAVVAAASRP